MQVQGSSQHVSLGDISDFPTRFNPTAWLSGRATSSGSWPVRDAARPQVTDLFGGREVIGFSPSDSSVHVQLDDGSRRCAPTIWSAVTADEARSGTWPASTSSALDPSISFMIAEGRGLPPKSFTAPSIGVFCAAKAEIGPVNPQRGRHPLIASLPFFMKEQRISNHTAQPTLDDLRAALVSAFYGSDFGAHDPVWLSRFTDATRQAISYRVGRVLLAGDAARIHSPHGGQGLKHRRSGRGRPGWKLAQVIRGVFVGAFWTHDSNPSDIPLPPGC